MVCSRFVSALGADLFGVLDLVGVTAIAAGVWMALALLAWSGCSSMAEYH